MWSGPRNISTAMMRAFENRPDCAVVDEPFYAAYLALTGIDHPMREDILRSQPTDWRTVADGLCGDIPSGRAIFYQKHMTHHMVDEIGRDWMAACRNVFLIRHPARVLASYARKRADITLADIGFIQQGELFDQVCGFGQVPAVIDADDLLADPSGMLRSLCAVLEVPFDEAMLAWPPGPRATDGVWAAHWYDAVIKSTGFEKPRPQPVLEDPVLRAIEDEAMPVYDRLRWQALKPAGR
jgi:hypothetical protein